MWDVGINDGTFCNLDDPPVDDFTHDNGDDDDDDFDDGFDTSVTRDKSGSLLLWM